ncbi:hypothetical protein TWF281_006654 [Arthrobotrys megalospora]
MEPLRLYDLLLLSLVFFGVIALNDLRNPVLRGPEILIHKRGTSKAQTVDLRVFTIKPGHEKDKELGKVRKYIKATLGSNEEETEERWALDHTGGVMWFYLKSTERIAKDILEKWNQTIEAFSTLEFKGIHGGSQQASNFDATGPTVTNDSLDDPGNEADSYDSSSAHHIKRAIDSRVDALENCLLSQPPGYDLPNPCHYLTDATQGEGDFRHVNWGRSKDHIFIDDKDNLPRKIKFLNPTLGSDPTSMHGTMILGKLLGAKFGVARKVKPILVKTSDRKLRESGYTLMEGLEKVARDIKRKTLASESKNLGTPKFIVLTAYLLTDLEEDAESQMAEYRHNMSIATLSQMPNVAVIAGAGNGVPRARNVSDPSGLSEVLEMHKIEPVNYAPAKLGGDPITYPNLIVCGAVNPRDGQLVLQSADFIRIFAPGLYINVPIPAAGKSWGGKAYKITYGTSLTSPVIAGVLATLISANNYTMSEAIAQLYSLAYSRKSSRITDNSGVYPNVVYNGMGQPPGPQEASCATARGDSTAEGICDSDSPSETISNQPTATQTTATLTEVTQIEHSSLSEAELCTLCLQAKGEVPINGVIWIPSDCPCKGKKD